MALLSDRADASQRLARRIEHVALASQPNYQDVFVDAISFAMRRSGRYRLDANCLHGRTAAPISAKPSSSAPALRLFQVFELGLLGIGAHVVDSLHTRRAMPELYPDKPIL